MILHANTAVEPFAIWQQAVDVILRGEWMNDQGRNPQRATKSQLAQKVPSMTNGSWLGLLCFCPFPLVYVDSHWSPASTEYTLRFNVTPVLILCCPQLSSCPYCIDLSSKRDEWLSVGECTHECTAVPTCSISWKLESSKPTGKTIIMHWVTEEWEHWLQRSFCHSSKMWQK